MSVEDPVCRDDVAFEGDGGVLRDADSVAVLGERVVHALPAGTVDETAVHEHDVLNGGRDANLQSERNGRPDGRPVQLPADYVK
jgi:hypothetical protein